MDKTEYLWEIKSPRLIVSDINDITKASHEIEEYLKELEKLRLGFIEFISANRDKVALAYYGELERALMILQRRIEGVFSIRSSQVGLLCDNLKKPLLLNMKASLEKTIDFVQSLLPCEATSCSVITSPVAVEQPSKPKDVPRQSKLRSKLEEYDEFLSVKDICDIFKITPRTVSNWESQGLLINLSEVSDERTSLGRKKRGKKKQYRKDTLIKNVTIQEKYNELR